MFSAGRPNATRLFIATVVLLAAAVGATQRGSQADATTGCGSDDLTVVTRDDHSGALIPDRALNEQLVVALEGPPTLVAYTLPTQDLPDALDRIESSVGTLAVEHDTETVYAVHRSIPEPRSGSNRAFGNSIVPEEITFRCLTVVSPTTLVPSTTVPTTTTTVPVISTSVPATTTPPSTVEAHFVPTNNG